MVEKYKCECAEGNRSLRNGTKEFIQERFMRTGQKYDVLGMETEVLKRTEKDQTIIHSIFIQ